MLITRDPFARVELHRETVKRVYVSTNRFVCAWCGQPAKYCYRYEADSGRSADWSRPFCGVDCFRSYTH